MRTVIFYADHSKSTRARCTTISRLLRTEVGFRRKYRLSLKLEGSFIFGQHCEVCTQNAHDGVVIAENLDTAASDEVEPCQNVATVH